MNQPLPSSRPPSTRGIDEVGEEIGGAIVVEKEEVTFVCSPDEWVTHILSGLRDPLESCISDTRKESPSPKSDEQSHR